MKPIILSILFVFILVRSREPHVGAIARPRDFAVSLWSECSAHDERPIHGERKEQCQEQSKHQVRGIRTARRDKIDIWAGRLSAKQPKTLRMVIDNQHAPYRSLKFFANGAPLFRNQGCEYYFFGVSGPDEAAAVVVARRTVVPVVRESERLTITLSDSVTPPSISDYPAFLKLRRGTLVPESPLS